ncbi:toxic anion resistance protein [Nocardioides sp. Kera G14]|uniref:toxic anion resistance protein n=1 Tax=Nocardioides sp. Kera G14 TaxID=2884264 RepID=UPI001D1190ED|nr:toxic anion resistance protein [Nocardioides sp. Kera G14]UDY23239.1 toxic anion resistance protein [Nocardioides sp. Kera G14]
MSDELDLDVTTPAPAAAGIPLTPPAQAATSNLVLAPPAPVAVVEPEQAAGSVPVDPAKQTELQARAAAFAEELAAMDTRSPEFTKKVESITSMGDKDIRATASVSNRMLERPAAIVKGAKGTPSGDAQTRVSNTLVDLRNTVTELDPNRADLTGVKKVLKWIPGGDKVQRYFAKYESAQSHLDGIIKSLASGQDELRKDNAAIETEKANMWAAMGRLNEYQTLASALDGAVEQKIAQLEAAGRTDDANTMRSDVLFAIRQRHQDILTQLAVSVQGYMALDLIRRNNLELIKGVDRAQTTTVAALRTAVIVSQALSRQKLVLDQINALNTTTSNLIESTSQQLKMQGAQINQQAASSTIDIAKLQAAFDNVFATMDALDTFRAQAVDSMAETVNALEGQIQRARPYLERTRAGEARS